MAIFYQDTIDLTKYFQNVLPIALKHENKIVGEYWTFQQDGSKPHIHHLTHKMVSR